MVIESCVRLISLVHVSKTVVVASLIRKSTHIWVSMVLLVSIWVSTHILVTKSIVKWVGSHLRIVVLREFLSWVLARKLAKTCSTGRRKPSADSTR